MMNTAGYTRPCPQCGEPMGKTRGVCPECGHMTAWFKVRLFIGGFFALLALIGILLMVFAPPG